MLAPVSGTSTERRRAALRAILAEGRVRSQAELMARLEALGIQASQPVVSRDLRRLKAAKRDGTSQVLDEERVTPLTALKSLLRGEAAAPQLALVRCEPGAASAIARALEAESIDGVLGTLAGDDTVLVVVSSPGAARRVRRRVADLLEG
jgi:transcriptional regulator of arginine metabolism